MLQVGRTAVAELELELTGTNVHILTIEHGMVANILSRVFQAL